MEDSTVEHVPFTFNELLARQRIAMRKTQRQVVDELRQRGFDFTTQALSNWESGKNPPSDPAVVYALEEILECPGELSDALRLAPQGRGRVDVLEERLEVLERDLGSLRQELRDALSELRGSQ